MKTLCLRPIWAAGILLCLSLSGCYWLRKQSEYYGISTKARQVAFVLDISGSMEWLNEPSVAGHLVQAGVQQSARILDRALGGGFVGGMASRQLRKESTKLGAARRELIPTLKGLLPDTRFSIVTFSHSVKDWRSTPIEATPENKTAATFFVNNLKAGGATAANAALTAALNIPGVEVIFFLSDGQPTDARPADILRSTAAAGRQVVIHSIGVGDDQDEQFMRELAAQHNGQYYRSQWRVALP